MENCSDVKDVGVVGTKLFRDSISHHRKELNSDIVKDDQFFTKLIQAMQTNFFQRSCYDKQLIFTCLATMPSMTQLSREAHGNYYFHILDSISSVLRYEKVEANRVIFKTGADSDKCYIVLKGKLSVIKPKEVKELLTEEEYVMYLARLWKNEETEIMGQCISRNQKLLSINFDDIRIFLKRYYEKFSSTMKAWNDYIDNAKLRRDSLFYEEMNSIHRASVYPVSNDDIRARKKTVEKKASTRNVLSTHVESVDDYIKHCSPLYMSSNDNRKQYRIVKLIVIRNLEHGDKFGDLSYNTHGNKRSATVISIDECHLGTIDYISYIKILKDIDEKIRRSSVNFLLSQQVLTGISRYLFEQYIFNYFVYEKSRSNSVLIHEGDTSHVIYFLREGEYEIFSMKSLREIGMMITALGGESNLTQEIETYGEKFINQKRYNRITIIKNTDVIGLSDLMYGDKFAYSVKCLSDKCEYFKIDSEDFKAQCLAEAGVRDYAIRFIEIKKKLYLKRLIEIKSGRLKCQTLFKTNNTRTIEDSNSSSLSRHENMRSSIAKTNRISFMQLTQRLLKRNNNNNNNNNNISSSLHVSTFDEGNNSSSSHNEDFKQHYFIPSKYAKIPIDLLYQNTVSSTTIINEQINEEPESAREGINKTQPPLVPKLHHTKKPVIVRRNRNTSPSYVPIPIYPSASSSFKGRKSGTTQQNLNLNINLNVNKTIQYKDNVIDLLTMDNFNRVYNSDMYFYKYLNQEKCDTEASVQVRRDVRKESAGHPVRINTQKSLRNLNLNTPKYKAQDKFHLSGSGNVVPKKRYEIMVCEDKSIIFKREEGIDINEYLTTTPSISSSHRPLIGSRIKRAVSYYNVMKKAKASQTRKNE